ncbi:methyltransferase domain-containing protein [Poseidonocella sedimentorum]|uniref:Methyltransferase domain-containing protein n=1 Tax=Poseidonocella sedimentorum TaxID=871652 RepID=A0A1I6ED33_9RHOB|nr:class I SAM-dependent methyltransferase [Poseidonocella sedimentorum]SFR15653.1 Methyltransferase domain-containing protein [Poseidonocella sedimentorum]
MSINQIITDVWNEMDDETRRQELSHWRGVGKYADDKKWLSIGNRSVKRLGALRRFAKQRGPLSDQRPVMLEWGQGGGANAFAFKEVAEAYYGVDIAEKNLGEATRVLTEAGKPDLFRPVLLTGEPSEIVGQIEPVDIILSTAVFQHFPTKGYGYEVLKAMRAVCKDGALGLIQIRYDNGDSDFRANVSVEQYKDRFIKATSYQLDEFWSLCEDAGFTPQYLTEIAPKSHYATFALIAG